METTTAVKVYSGSLEELRGGAVLWARPCSCGQCTFMVMGARTVYGRVKARVTDPAAPWRSYEIEHARRESVGLEPW